MNIEITEGIIYIGILVCFVLSLIPFPLSKGWKSWSLYIPIVGTLLYVVYEELMPAEMNIRVDLIYLYPILISLWLNGIAKIWIMIMGHRNAYIDLLFTCQIIFSLLAVFVAVMVFF